MGCGPQGAVVGLSEEAPAGVRCRGRGARDSGFSNDLYFWEVSCREGTDASRATCRPCTCAGRWAAGLLLGIHEVWPSQLACPPCPACPLCPPSSPAALDSSGPDPFTT